MWWLNLFLTFRPKNFQVRQLFKYDRDDMIPVSTLGPKDKGFVEYYFGGQVYAHIGTWPPQSIKPRFMVPIQHAIFVNQETGKASLCTERVKQYMSGPTESQISFDKYIPIPYIQLDNYKIKIRLKWRLYRKVRGTLYVCNILGQVTTYQV